MTVSFRNATDAIKNRLRAAANRVKGAVRRDRGNDLPHTEDRLAEQAREKPIKTDLSSSTSVSETDADDALEQAGKKVETRWPAASDLAHYGTTLTDEIIGGSTEHPGLQRAHQALSQTGFDPGSIQQYLADRADEHVAATIQHLPQSFGLPKEAIHEWLRQSHKPDSIAADLKQFLTKLLARQGHGAAVADWLYQQILAAGSTCMAAQELEVEGGNIERCKEYLQRTITEISGNASKFNNPALAANLLAQWHDAATARQKWDNERIQALSHRVQVRRENRPSRSHSLRQETTSATSMSDEDAERSETHSSTRPPETGADVDTGAAKNETTPKAFSTRTRKKLQPKTGSDKQPKSSEQIKRADVDKALARFDTRVAAAQEQVRESASMSREDDSSDQ